MGFHNYDDEVIDVHGDLFVVGTNESGKTTILDALHLVLSGGQDLDFNAAAKMAGRRDEGRTLQGIILRADLSGNPTRKGGSITYAVAEFEHDGAKSAPTTLVFGASVGDMNARPQRWGVITKRGAAELPLVGLDADGTRRIVHCDELSGLLDEPILHDMGRYRTAVADLLFKNRDDFDRVTDLWRKAKSYRELSKAARGFDEIFRQVLPAPDTEPFDKVAKGFRDIAEIEQKLADFGEDVKALHQLCSIRDQAREARESLRRYRYVEARWYADELAGTLQSGRDEIVRQQGLLGSLAEAIERLEGEAQVLSEQIATLRANEGYQTAAQLQEVETRLKGIDATIAKLEDRLRQTEARLRQELEKQAECRKTGNGKLSEITKRLDEIGETLLDLSDQTLEQLFGLQHALPKSMDDALSVELLRQAMTTLKRGAARIVDDTVDSIHRKEGQRAKLSSDRHEREQELQRLERFGDMVPVLAGLDEALGRLQQEGIAARLLYQELEFQPNVSEEVQAAAEAALGIQRLSTLIVPTEDTPKAQEIVLGVGHGIRLLDARAVQHVGDIRPKEGTGLLNLLRSAEDRVWAHLQATIGSMALLRQPAPDGANQHWFVAEGAGGERGARWHIEPGERRWIGESTRRRVREQREAELKSTIDQLGHDIEAVAAELSHLENVRQILAKLPDRLDDLDLPGCLERIWGLHDQLKERIAETERQISIVRKDLAAEHLARKHLAQTIADLTGQLAGIDVEAIKKRLGELEAQEKAKHTAKGGCQNEQQNARTTIQQLETQVSAAGGQLEEARMLQADARDELMAILSPEVDDLDHYVFNVKRASQIKKENLPKLLQDAVAEESEKTTRLRGADGVMSDRLATRYRFRVDDESGRIEVRDHRDQSLDQIFGEREETEREWHELLKKKNLELIEKVLARDLTDRLRSDNLMLDRTVRGLNRVLERLTFGHSRFQLAPKLTAEHSRFVNLIRRQSLLDPEQRRELRDHLENRKEQLTGEGTIPPFLDYRNWYQYRFQLQHIDSAEVTSLGSDELVRGSGGAQGTHHYLLLFALARFLFDGCGARVRLLMMDEAFYGLDMQRKELLLRCAKELGLDLVIASPDLDGTILEDAADSTTVMVEKDERDNVTLIPLVWKKCPAQANFLSEPRPEAVIGYDHHE